MTTALLSDGRAIDGFAGTSCARIPKAVPAHSATARTNRREFIGPPARRRDRLSSDWRKVTRDSAVPEKIGIMYDAPNDAYQRARLQTTRGALPYLARKRSTMKRLIP